ncbi:hypothetical protein [Paraburkholderia mimosarum]|uniref:hypothetical protein n=1 Tax=Paraburkholderia mimosarum TaxID=312026 RepID=UPI0012DE1154|nr:hypothetical protein [Paraburkholderia mimosarum]
MTDSHPRQPLSPAEFLKAARRSKHKLRGHTALVRQLMEAGLNHYQIWKYLTEEIGIQIGRTTANRFCNALRADDVHDSARASGGGVDTTAVTGGGSVSWPANSQCGYGEAIDASVDPGWQPASAGNQNEAAKSAAFSAPANQQRPTMNTSPSWADIPPGERILRYSSATPEARAALLAFHEALGSNGGSTNQGTQNGERTDIEK